MFVSDKLYSLDLFANKKNFCVCLLNFLKIFFYGHDKLFLISSSLCQEEFIFFKPSFDRQVNHFGKKKVCSSLKQQYRA